MSYKFPAGFLRIFGMVVDSAHNTAALHVPPIPFSRHTSRGLEDELQSTIRVKFIPPLILLEWFIDYVVHYNVFMYRVIFPLKALKKNNFVRL